MKQNSILRRLLMALLKLKSASFILLEDTYNNNILPLLNNIVENDKVLNIFCYEQSPSVWRKVFKNKDIQIYDDSMQQFDICKGKEKITVLIDSMNQMVLSLGWNKCVQCLKKFQINPNITKVVVILHKDCLLPLSKLHKHLRHLADAIVSFESSDLCKVNFLIKKSGKIYKSEELLSYDFKASVLISRPIETPDKKDEAQDRVTVSPADLSTFKIEVDQVNQLAKNQLKLPYMSKINEGKGKVYYEPDAVDDWDDEDPDDDLDI